MDRKQLDFKIEKQKDATGLSCDRVKTFVNGVDLLGNRHLGLTVEEMLEKDKFFRPGELLLGGCLCGDNDCDPFYVDVAINDDTVIWKGWHKFDKTEYCAAIKGMQEMLATHLSKHEKDFKEYQNAICEWLTEKAGIPKAKAGQQMREWACSINIETSFEENRSAAEIASEIASEIIGL